jgi:SHS2 domain-containing protein
VGLDPRDSPGRLTEPAGKRARVYRWIEHTGELELEISAPSEEAVFAEALAAYRELVARAPGSESARYDIRLNAPDRAALLVEWLHELVFLAETEDFVPERVVALELDDAELRASVEGRRDSPAHLVKSVTYHGLELRPDGDGWLGRVVLDV